MPSVADHKRQAEKNEEMAAKLEGEYPDWSVTAYFYAALHLTRAWLKDRGYGDGDYQSHLAAEEALEEEHFDVLEDYKHLKTLSERARYECPSDSEMRRVLPIAKEIFEDIKGYTLGSMTI